MQNDDRFLYRNMRLSHSGFWGIFPHTERRVFAVMRWKSKGRTVEEIGKAFRIGVAEIQAIIRIYKRLPESWKQHGSRLGNFGA